MGQQPVPVALSSEHGSLLKAVEVDLAAIPYSATFDGNALNLAGTAKRTRTPAPSLAGSAYELSVRLGSVANRFPGAYKDTILVNVDGNRRLIIIGKP